MCGENLGAISAAGNLGIPVLGARPNLKRGKLVRGDPNHASLPSRTNAPKLLSESVA